MSVVSSLFNSAFIHCVTAQRTVLGFNWGGAPLGILSYRLRIGQYSSGQWANPSVDKLEIVKNMKSQGGFVSLAQA